MQDDQKEVDSFMRMANAITNSGKKKESKETIHEALSNFAEEDLWKEIYFRRLRRMAAHRDIIMTDTELREMAANAHDSNDDEEDELFRRCEDMFEEDDEVTIDEEAPHETWNNLLQQFPTSRPTGLKEGW